MTSTGLVIGSCAYMAARTVQRRARRPGRRRVLADVPALRVPDWPGAVRGGRRSADDGRTHVLAAAAAEHHAPRNQPRLRRRRRQGHGQEAHRQVHHGGRTGQGRRGGVCQTRRRSQRRFRRARRTPRGSSPRSTRTRPGRATSSPTAGAAARRRRTRSRGSAPTQVALVVIDGRDVRRGRGPRHGPGLRRPRWWLGTADHARRAAARDDDGHDHARSPSEESTVLRRQTTPRRHDDVAVRQSEPISGVSGPTGRGSSGIRRAATREARLRRRSGPRIRLPSCVSRRRARTTTAANACATAPISNSPMCRRRATDTPSTNPADGARYEVQPDMLTISSRGGVDSAEPALEYGSDQR